MQIHAYTRTSTHTSFAFFRSLFRSLFALYIARPADNHLLIAGADMDVLSL